TRRPPRSPPSPYTTLFRSQRQLVGEINLAPEQADPLDEFAREARALLDGAAEGIDTDGDGLSDAAETGLVEIGNQLVAFLTVIRSEEHTSELQSTENIGCR